ncbi:MAG: CRISPR-associated endonuclease Cas3'', partial [Acidimicrobiia bacterium]|nr:CRISPR-associated endonuclease Cas3'' [Acidimicrobiia bacterium]
LGSDCLYLLDEVHLARPFAQSLAAVGSYREWAEEHLDAAPMFVVSMSATPDSAQAQSTFGLTPDDRDPDVTPELVRRLSAAKPTTTKKVSLPADREGADARFAAACAKEAVHLVKANNHVRTVAIVVNRVDTARRVVTELDGNGQTTILLTGRMRDLDRQALLEHHLEKIASGRTRAATDEVLYVAATQCVEAGADFDFDAVVSECAPLDSLRQRMGRLDRLGHLSRAGTPAQAAVLVRSSDLGTKAVDPVYGQALKNTWAWLDRAGDLDFGIDRLDVPAEKQLEPLLAPRLDAPVMLPAHLDLLAQTRPGPAVEPDVALFLHGDRPVETDVNVVWRADLTRNLLDAAWQDATAAARVFDIVTACPPAPVESLSVPIGAVRAWLTRVPAGATYDVEGQPPSEEARGRGTHQGRSILRWRGDDSTIVAPGEINPGDTIVVPSEDGGIRRHSWDPTADEDVSDIGDIAQAVQRSRASLRLHPALWTGCPIPPPRPPSEGMDPVDPTSVIRDWLAGVSNWAAGSELGRVVDHLDASLRRGRRAATVQQLPRADAPGESYWVVQARRPLPTASEDGPFDPDTSSFTAVQVELSEHLDGVGRWAEAFARRCGLADDVVVDLELAGRLHDLGKADPRFQLLLHGGDPVRAAISGDLIAKSAIPAQDRRAREVAAQSSRYPRGGRHELTSLALIDGVAEIRAQANDWDLVRHLVASHHGWCRPFAPIAPDPEPVEVGVTWAGTGLQACSAHGMERIDSGVADRFWSLTRRYGWHGLAWLETILRLADHRRSEEEAAHG